MEIKGYFVSDIPRRAFLERTLKGGLVLAAGPTLSSLLEGCAGSGKASAEVQIDPQILEATIRAAVAQGGDFADVYVENRIARSIVMEESRFKSAEFGVSQGAGVRVIAGDRTGYAYTEEITEEALLGRPRWPPTSPGAPRLRGGRPSVLPPPREVFGNGADPPGGHRGQPAA